MIAIFVYNNIHNNNYYCNYYIADHDSAAAAAAAAAADDDNFHADDDNNVDGDNVHFQMLSINMLTMILMSNIITTATTHLPAFAFSRLPLQDWMHPSTLVCLEWSCRSYKIPGRVQG